MARKSHALSVKDPDRNYTKGTTCSFIEYPKLPANFNTDMLTDQQYREALTIGVTALVVMGKIRLEDM